MSKGFKFGQIVGIIVGVIGGSILVNLALSPFKQPQQVVAVNPNLQGQIPVTQQQKGVFEQALTMQRTS